MNAAVVIGLAIKLSLAVTVFGVGLHATWRDTMYLFRHRDLLARSLFAMSVVMPLLVLWTTVLLDLKSPVGLALITLALSPVPPFLPNKAMKSGGGRAYVVGLFAAVSLLSIAIVPLSVELLGRLFGVPFHLSPGAVARIVGVSVLAPLLLGIGVRDLAPAFARRAVKPVTRAASVILIAAIVPLLFKSWPAVRSLLGDGTLLALIALAAAGLAIGHFLGGPRHEDRTVLALATATRHPGVAMLIVGATRPSEELAGAAVLLALLVNAAVSSAYTKRTKEQDWEDHAIRARRVTSQPL